MPGRGGWGVCQRRAPGQKQKEKQKRNTPTSHRGTREKRKEKEKEKEKTCTGPCQFSALHGPRPSPSSSQIPATCLASPSLPLLPMRPPGHLGVRYHQYFKSNDSTHPHSAAGSRFCGPRAWACPAGGGSLIPEAKCCTLASTPPRHGRGRSHPPPHHQHARHTPYLRAADVWNYAILSKHATGFRPPWFSMPASALYRGYCGT